MFKFNICKEWKKFEKDYRQEVTDSVNFVEDPGRLQFTSDKKDEPKILSCSSVFYQERS